ncbi:MAG: hypothetical protein VB084_05535 [Syntrophomonadaceae bacterium]|nr:hypothetical protein [Syntrophomonadaceae bacterium]
MNVAKKLEAEDKSYDKKAKAAEVIYLPDRKAEEDKKYTNEYLNEKLAYFYAHGGPVMDI